jgi:type II secretory pathway predicted ATPase ExeA
MTTYFYYNPEYFKNKLKTLSISDSDFGKMIAVPRTSINQVKTGRYQVINKTPVFDAIMKGLKDLGVEDTHKFLNKTEETPTHNLRGDTSSIYRFFGFESDPFISFSETFKNSEFDETIRTITQVVNNSEMRAFTGAVGAGKSTILKHSLKIFGGYSSIRVCTIPSVMNKWIDSMNIYHTIIDKLWDRKPPTKRFLKVEKFMTVMEVFASQGTTAAVFIDEAQNLTQNGLKDIRLIHESVTESGKIPLAFILFAKPELSAILKHPALAEVSLRLPITRLESFSSDTGKSSIPEYMRFKLKNSADIFSPEAVQYIIKTSRTPLDVDIRMKAGMSEAFKDKESTILVEHIQGGLHG